MFSKWSNNICCTIGECHSITLYILSALCSYMHDFQIIVTSKLVLFKYNFFVQGTNMEWNSFKSACLWLTKGNSCKNSKRSIVCNCVRHLTHTHTNAGSIFRFLLCILGIGWGDFDIFLSNYSAKLIFLPPTNSKFLITWLSDFLLLSGIFSLWKRSNLYEQNKQFW